MDVEIYDLIDDSMEISHQIGTELIEFCKKEQEGAKVNVLNNKIIIILFERLQKVYRQIEEKFEEIREKIKTESKGDVLTRTSNIEIDIDTSENINELKDYIETSYRNMRFIPIQIEENIYQASIYENTEFEMIRLLEYELQIDNLNYLFNRIATKERGEKLNFTEKADLLEQIAKLRFYENYSFKQLDKYRNAIGEQKFLTIQEKEEIRNNLLTYKYTMYYEYLNLQYNGEIQKNDTGKYKFIKDLMKDNKEALALNMLQSDIDANLSLYNEEQKEAFRKSMRDICRKTYVKKEEKPEMKQEVEGKQERVTQMEL